MNNNKKTVFISSTFIDLKIHRDQIWNVLQNFDVNITGMEEFGARKSTPLQTCLKEIEESDIYIGIVSMCYGSVDETTYKSYTQLEYEKARECGLDILIYLIDERNGVVKTGNIDSGDKLMSLNHFKNILKKNHTVDFFINEIDLGQKIYKKLEKLMPKPASIIERPREIEAKIERISSGNIDWIFFIGYLNGKPYEVFSGINDDETGIMMPKTVNEGLIIKDESQGYIRFDFQFKNRRGYKTTIEGINEVSTVNEICVYSSVISKLLQNNVSIDVISDSINAMEIKNKKFSSWNYNIISILKK